MRNLFLCFVVIAISLLPSISTANSNKTAIFAGLLTSRTSTDSLWGDCMLYVVDPLTEEQSVYSCKVKLNNVFFVQVPVSAKTTLARCVLQKSNEEAPFVIQSLFLQSETSDTLTYDLDESRVRFSSGIDYSSLDKANQFMEEFIDKDSDNPISSTNRSLVFKLQSLSTIKKDFEARMKKAGLAAEVDIQNMEFMQLARAWAWMLYIANKVFSKPFQGTADERRMFFHELVSPVVKSANVLPLISFGRGDFFYGLETQFPQWRQSFLCSSDDWRRILKADLLLANDEKTSVFANALTAQIFLGLLNAKELLSDAQSDKILQGLDPDVQLQLRELFKRRKKELSLPSNSYNLSDSLSQQSLEGLQEKYRDKKIVLDYWFEGCSACVDLEKKLERLKVDLTAEDVVFISVTDISMTSLEAWKYFTNRPGEHYLLSKDTLSKLSGKYKVENYPTLLLLDKERNIANRWVGLMTEKEIQQLQEQLDHK